MASRTPSVSSLSVRQTDGVGAVDDEGDNASETTEQHSNVSSARADVAASADSDAPDGVPEDRQSAQEGERDTLRSGTEPSASKIEALEIEMGDVDGYREDDQQDVDLDAADGDNDMEQLLPSSNGNSTDAVGRRNMTTVCGGCIQVERVGNMFILFPRYHAATGWGVMGPHWFGPLCVLALLALGTHLCIRGAIKHLGPVTVATCLSFFSIATVMLFDVSFRDPGISRSKEIPDDAPSNTLSQWRWCDFCSAYQPPDGAHCPECNVCIAGYDHHCVWMGTCIGKHNYRQFVRFNMCWLYFVAYAVFWIATFGPLLYKTW